MENPFEENQAGQVKRPTLLTVLCILTFIGSGWGALSNMMSFFTADVAAVQVEQSMDALEQLGDSSGSSFISELMASSQAVLPYMKPIAGINCLLALLSLLGAVFMFRLRKVGFYPYTGAQLLMLFVTPAFIGFGGTAVMLTLLFSAVLTLLFIILYSLNLKYMK